MPRPRATIFQRQAQHTVVSTAEAGRGRQRPAVDRRGRRRGTGLRPAARRRRSTSRRHPRTGPTSTPSGSSARPIRSRQDQQVGVVHGDGELSGRGLRQTPARVGAASRQPARPRCSHAAPHPAGEPLRRQVGLRRRRVARGSAGRGPRPPAGRTPRRRPRRRPGRAGGPARSCGAGGRRTRRPRGRPADPPGSARRGRRRTGSAARDSRAPAQTATSPASSSPVSRSSSAEAVMRVAPARSPGRSRVMSDRLVSTVTAAPSAAGPGRSAAATSSRSASRSCTTQCCGPGSSGASQRPIAPVPQPRSWITLAGRPPGGVARGARRGRRHGPRRRRARAGRAIPG